MIRSFLRELSVAMAVASVALLIFAGGALFAHDLFLRPVRFFVAPGEEILVRMLNGTFTSSEGGVSRDRVRDLRAVSENASLAIDTSSLEVGKTESVVHLTATKPGTYVVGISLRPRTIRLEGKAFNEYLRSDGIPSILEQRSKSGELELPARERYSKHVKAIVQVGDARSKVVNTVFGYPAELVPLDNPYRKNRRAGIRLRALVDGHPIAGQVILYGGAGDGGVVYKEKAVETGADGVAVVMPAGAGKWYAKFINMRSVRGAAGDSVDYESKWTTLTFGIR